MDEQLRELARAVETDPSDEAAARRYDAALLNAAQRERVKERYRFKFQCPLRWEDLAETHEPGVRHCSKCDRNVHAVADPESLRRNVVEGRCVAFPEALYHQAFDRLEDEKALHSAAAPERPCIVLSRLPASEIEERALDALPAEIVHKERIVPLTVREGRVVVAVSPRRLSSLEQIRRRTATPIAAVLTSEEELNRLYRIFSLRRPERPRRALMGFVSLPRELRRSDDDSKPAPLARPTDRG